jgi:hypothetical protein
MSMPATNFTIPTITFQDSRAAQTVVTRDKKTKYTGQ